jgi:DNA-binding MarR family transcriptional regulator
MENYIIILYNQPMSQAAKIADARAVAYGLDRLTMWGRRHAPTKLSATTITTLTTLSTDGPQRISDLADREAISQPGMTTLVNRLEAAGQAERITDPADGRVALVRITDAGRAVLAERLEARTQAMFAGLQRLEPADRAALLAALPAIERLVTVAPSPVPVRTEEAMS